MSLATHFISSHVFLFDFFFSLFIRFIRVSLFNTQCVLLQVIEGITDVIRKSNGVYLLSVNSKKCFNTTEYGMIGEADQVIRATLAATKFAHQMINTTSFNALQVCIFSPMVSTRFADCVHLAHRFAREYFDLFNLTTYVKTENIFTKLSGSYEYWINQVNDPEPHFKPLESTACDSATVVIATDKCFELQIFLIATDEQVTRIANQIRESANRMQDALSKCHINSNKSSQSDFKLPSVSIVFPQDDHHLHPAYWSVCEVAKKLKLPVVGSLIHGMVPLRIVLDTAEFLIAMEDLFVLEEEHRVRLVVDRLGLSNLTQFRAKEKIMEYSIEIMCPKVDRLIDLPLNQFIYSVGDRSTLPAGGSTCATVAALGCALASMVSKKSYGHKKVQEIDPQMRRLIPIFDGVMKKVTTYIDADTNVYKMYVNAQKKLVRSKGNERILDENIVQEKLKDTVNVPLLMAQDLDELWTPLTELAELIIISNLCDLEVGVNCILLGIKSCLCNITTNLHSVTDMTYKEYVKRKIDEIVKRSEQKSSLILSKIEERKKH